MPNLVPVQLDEAIAEVERELKLRAPFYARQVTAGRMSSIAADRQTDRLEAARAFLIELKRLKGGDYVGSGEGGALAG